MVIDGFIINEAKRGIFRAVEVDSQMVQWVIDNMDHYTEPCFDTNKALCEGTWKSECTKTPKVMAKCRKTCGTCSKTSSRGELVKVDEAAPLRLVKLAELIHGGNSITRNLFLVDFIIAVKSVSRSY